MHNLDTRIGSFIGNERENSFEYLGIRYASSKRFEYASLVNQYGDNYDATKMRDTCMQKRVYHPHLEQAERRFYLNEFRKGIEYTYSDDCLNLNIWTPKKPGKYPVIIFFHGGGFDSGSIDELEFDGDKYALNDTVMVIAEYRVGIFGYITHQDIYDKYGRDGNIGLDDMYKSILWVKENINEFYGDENNITLMGQSAGAISIQYLSLSKKTEGLYNRAIMMSGGGLFPKFSLPRRYTDTREYWSDYMKSLNVNSIEELAKIDDKTLFDQLEIHKSTHKGNTYNTMPVIDDYLITAPIDELIKTPNKIDYMLGYTNNDLFAILMANIALKYAKNNNAYTYYLDIDLPGDNNKAFHSSDLWYAFGTMKRSWRPFNENDYRISDIFIKYITNFAKTGNPNSDGLPEFKVAKNKSLCIRKDEMKMGKPNKFKLIYNTLFRGIK